MKKIITIFVLVIMCVVAVSCNAGDKDAPFFPVQKAGLEQMEALLEGKLEMDDGYLRVKYFDDNYLLIWPYGFSLRSVGDEIQIIDRDGQIVACVGDIVTVGGGETTAEVVEKAIGRRLPDDCEGPYWLVGDVLDSSPPSPEALTPEKLEELAEKYRDDPAMFDAAVYAMHEGIEIDEAVYRLEIMNNAGPYGAELEENEAETLAGFWIQHEPEFGLVAAFTRDGEETLEKYREKYPELVAITEVVEMKYTLKELLEAQTEANHLLERLGLFYSSATMVKTNQVEIYVTDSELFYSTLEESGEKLPECVVPIIIYEPLEGVPEGLNPDPSVHFPQLKMASGTYMTALMVGELTLEDGYLRVHGALIIWQPDYFVHNNNGTIEIWDRDGKVVGRVGEEIVMGGGEIPFEFVNKLLKEPLPLDTEGPFWLQGTGTRLSLNFSSELFDLEVIPVKDENICFLKKKPLLDEFATTKKELTGKLIVCYDAYCLKCPRITVGDMVELYLLIWPADYEAQVENGVFEIVDKSGNIVARDGEEMRLEGFVLSGINTDVTRQLFDELPGGCFQPYLIVNRILGSEK